MFDFPKIDSGAHLRRRSNIPRSKDNPYFLGETPPKEEEQKFYPYTIKEQK